MNTADFTKAKELAQKIIAENFVHTPPVPIAAIAQNYGLRVGALDFSDNSSAVAGVIDLSKMTIAYNKDDAPTRQAFTIAHELGHFFLHKEEIVQSGNIDVLFRRPLGRPDPDWKEQEANCFAANLLVPEQKLREYMDAGYTEYALASVFGVSRDVIGFRLQDNGFARKSLWAQQ